MIERELDAHSKEHCIAIYEFIKCKVEVEALYDYEIANELNAMAVVDGRFRRTTAAKIGRLRKKFGIKKANGFLKRFGLKYGPDAVETFKKMIANPGNSLSIVGRHFGFSREYARQVYKKIYGCPYTGAYKRKRLVKNGKPAAARRKSRYLESLIKVKEKIEALGPSSYITKKNHGYLLLANGFRLAFRSASRPRIIGGREYFCITNSKMTSHVDYDFLICLCRAQEQNTYYVIPSDAMPKHGISLPFQAGPYESKYSQFKEAWHLISHQNRKIQF